MADDPECVFPDQEHSSDVETWPEDGVAVVMRVAVRPDRRAQPREARRLGLAFQELAGTADA